MANTSAAVSINATGTNSSTLSVKISQILPATLLGFFIVFAVGLAPMEVAHNAAHDSRHSFSFPCH